LQGDITSEETIREILGHFKEEKADLVISDGAPDVTGMHDMDQYVQGQLIVAALTIVGRVLREGGTFVVRPLRAWTPLPLASFPFRIWVLQWSAAAANSRFFRGALTFIENLELSFKLKWLFHSKLFLDERRNVLESEQRRGSV
jgi:hypothetical protein